MHILKLSFTWKFPLRLSLHWPTGVQSSQVVFSLVLGESLAWEPLRDSFPILFLKYGKNLLLTECLYYKLFTETNAKKWSFFYLLISSSEWKMWYMFCMNCCLQCQKMQLPVEKQRHNEHFWINATTNKKQLLLWNCNKTSFFYSISFGIDARITCHLPRGKFSAKKWLFLKSY